MKNLIDRLKARLTEDKTCYGNNMMVYELCRPEIDRFENNEATNLYAVRLGYEHKTAADKDRRYTDDLEEVIAILEGLDNA